MLCYQSSRSANDVIRDTFVWLTDNARALRPVWLVALGVCVVCSLVVDFYAEEIFGYDFDPLESIFRQIGWPFGNNPGYAGVFSLLTAVTTGTTVPLVARYFVEHRSLKGMSRRSLEATEVKYLKRALLTAVIAALSTYISVAYSFWLMLLSTTLLIFVMPMTIMRRAKGFDAQYKGLIIIKSVLSLIMLYMITTSVPLLCFDLVYMVITILGEQVIGLSAEMLAQSHWLESLLGLTLYFAFCAADVMLIVGSVILHGTTFNNY